MSLPEATRAAKRTKRSAIAGSCWIWRREADTLAGEKDKKLKKAAEMVAGLLKDGFRPILFCRFIPTAEYVAEEFRKHLPKDVVVDLGYRAFTA